GSVIGGRAILALDPGALGRLAAGHRSAVVSGTNGKTTTTSLLRAALSTAGPVVTNLEGANLPPGLAAALAGGAPGARAALEVDEAWLGRVVAAVRPEVAVLLNLTRDQLDRNNEVRTLASSWRRTFAEHPDTVVVANCDDPLVVWGAGAAGAVRWVAAGQPWTADASGCPACGGAIEFDPPAGAGDAPPAGEDDASPAGGEAEPVAGQQGAPRRPTGDEAGGWRCTQCDLHRPPPDVRLAGDRVIDADGTVTAVRLELPGRANRANAAMALTAARCLGAENERGAEAMAETTEVVGRYRTVRMDGVAVRFLLAKNPAGWLEVLDMMPPPPVPAVVVINARIADGRDPSWLWDVPFERLAGRRVLATGERGRDLAVRLRYAGLDHRYVADAVDAVKEGVAEAHRAGTDRLEVVANYTSFQDLRARLP
ncbi:MAG TPA: MurT ligase domain-containing protein, partial [Acidimicrobiales bacterium]|nr:MurT ligase domain-containing protein [Acidimicrobiales bacterium]